MGTFLMSPHGDIIKVARHLHSIVLTAGRNGRTLFSPACRRVHGSALNCAPLILSKSTSHQMYGMDRCSRSSSRYLKTWWYRINYTRLLVRPRLQRFLPPAQIEILRHGFKIRTCLMLLLADRLELLNVLVQREMENRRSPVV